MPIFACGINHKTAPIELREKVIFSQEKMPIYLDDLVKQESIKEAVILSTCNRSELYCIAKTPTEVLDWFCRQHGFRAEMLSPFLYIHQDQAAIEHIMQVACGLDSMVLGESQILAQMKAAFSESSAASALGPTFNRLFQQVFAVAKEVRTNTSIGACPVSVSRAAVQFIKQNVPAPLHQMSLLLIGAGVSVDLVLRNLKGQLPKKIYIANRTQENAEKLANLYNAEVIKLNELHQLLPSIDIVITATGGTLPILTKESFSLCKNQLWIVDIAVPRDVEPSVSELSQVYLFSIDDLKSIIQKNFHGREHAAEKARDMIKQKSQEFIAWLQSMDMVSITIRGFRKQVEDLTRIELKKAYKQLQRGDDPHQVLMSFSHALTNKLLHIPSVQLRQAGFEGRLEVLQFVQQLFAIQEPKIEII